MTTTTMRVLCLHGAHHCGYSFHTELMLLEERLSIKHQIELVYVDSPLCDDGTFACEKKTKMSNHNNDAADDDDKCVENQKDIEGNNIPATAIDESSTTNNTISNALTIPPSKEITQSTTANRQQYPKQEQKEAQQEEQLPIMLRKWFDEDATSCCTMNMTQEDDDDDETKDYNEKEEVEEEANVVAPSSCSNAAFASSDFNNEPFVFCGEEQPPSTKGNDSNSSSSNNNDDVEKNCTPCEYVGMDASILHLLQIWNRDRSSRPFHGILAFDQGATLAGILPLIQKSSPHLPHFFDGLRFLILVSGFVLDPPPSRGCMALTADEHLKEDGIVDFMPTLHLIGRRNTTIEPEQSRRLARRFANAQVYEHPGGNTFPTRPRDFNVIGKFLVQRKKDLFQTLGSNAQLILQTQQQLSILEHQAANLIASTVALNPPKALMAVISPNAVGGWMGPKLRNPLDGGGAPCPSEFIRKRTERQTKATSQEGSGGGGGSGGQGDDNNDDDDENVEFRDASREHPKASSSSS